MEPTVLLVPGFWEGPAVYGRVSSLLTANGVKTEAVTLPTTGTASPDSPTIKDNIAAVRGRLISLLSRGESVLLVLHSAAGFVGSEAMQGLDAKQRHERGEKGGVVGIVFLAAGLVPEGLEHRLPPFTVVERGSAYPINPETSLFADLSESEKKEWLAALKPEPAQGWDYKITCAGWKDVPSVFLICDNDALLPPSLQEQFAGLANSKITRCSSGHMPQLSQPERVVEVIEAAITDFRN